YETITVPVGIFHLSSGSFQVRTIDIIIVIALLANALGSRSHQGLTFTALAWITFSAWVVTEGFVGVFNGNSKTFIGYEIKAVLYIGLFCLASRVSLREARTRLALERLLYFSAALSALTVTLGAVGKKININVPGLRGAQLGNVGSIGATLFVALGILALAIAICSERRRFPLLLAVAPLFVPPLMAHQRASLLNLAVSITALLVF